jgi:RIO kinase 1
MASGLEHLLAEGVISEVLARLQSGKEAEVYVVRFGGKVVAAKVYKDRAQRSFKNNSTYKEGRSVRNSRSQRAIDRGSKFGKSAAEDAWKEAEADALYKLHAAEVRVPTPVLYLDGVLLMELVLDGQGNAARRLIDTDLTVGEANAAYHDMIAQLVRILSCDLIHGDLSPYNVLWGADGPVIIDFPQIVSASHNSSSEQFFLRDADNILGHFARIDRSLMVRQSDPLEIWGAYRRRELTPDFRPSGRPRAARPAFVPQQAPMARAPQHPQPRPVQVGPPNGRPAPQGQGFRRGPSGPGGPQPGAPNQPRSNQGAGGSGSSRGSSVSSDGRGNRRGVRMPEVIVRHAPGQATSQTPNLVTGHPTGAHASPPPQPSAPMHRSVTPPGPSGGGVEPRAEPRTEGADGENRPAHRRRRRRR